MVLYLRPTGDIEGPNHHTNIALPRCLQRAPDLGVQQGSTGGVLGVPSSNQHVDIENWDLQEEAVDPQQRRDDNEKNGGRAPGLLVTTSCQLQVFALIFTPNARVSEALSNQVLPGEPLLAFFGSL
jgi:hypothetical protein